MPPTRRIIRKTRPAGRTFDEQFWPVIVALFVLGGFLAGTVAAYLSPEDPRWYANARTWYLVIPLATCLAITFLRRVDHRTVRRGVQFSVVIGLLIHLILLVVFVETDVFGTYWQDVAQAPVLEEPERLIEPEYQEFQLDPELRAEQIFERPTEIETPDPELPPARQRELADMAAALPTLAEPESQIAERSNVPERRELVESVPRYSDAPAAPRRTIEEAPQAQPSPAASLPAEARTMPELEAAATTSARAPAEAARIPQLQSAATEPRPRSQPPRTRRDDATAPQLSSEDAQLPAERTQTAPRTAQAAVAPGSPAESTVELSPEQPTLQRQAQAAAELTQPTAPAAEPAAAVADTALPRATTGDAPQVALTPSAAARPAPGAPQATAVAAQPPAASSRLEQEATLEPASLAVTRSLAGMAGIGQTPNVDQAQQAPASPSSVSSGRFARQETTQALPPGPNLEPSAASQLRRSQGDMPRPQAALVHNALQEASETGSRQPTELTASASASRERMASNAPAAPTTGVAGQTAIDLGPPRMRPDRGERAAGGGQPELQLANALTHRARNTSEGAGDAAPRPGMRAPQLATAADVPQTGTQGEAAAEDLTAAGPAAGAAERSEAAAAPSAVLEGMSADAPSAAEGSLVAVGQATRREAAAELPVGAALAAPARSMPRAVGGPPAATRVAQAEQTAESSGTPAAAPDASASDLVAAAGVPRGRATPAAGPSLDLEVAVGPAGFLRGDGLEAGVRSRRASRDSLQLQLPAARFQRQQTGGPPAALSLVARPTPSFGQRAQRLTEPVPGGGAGPQVDAAIELGLAFIARQQRADGSWSLQAVDPSAALSSDTAATGLSLLAFLGAGYHHREHQYANTVDRGLRYLVNGQKPNGDLFVPLDDESNRSVWLYSHAIAALALCEVYGMTQDPQLRDPAQRSVDFIVAAQDAEHGGWRYTPGFSSDTSVTGWMWMALKSAQLAQLDVPPSTFAAARRWLDLADSDQQRHLFRYNPFAPETPSQRHGREPSTSMTAVGLLLRLYDGQRTDDEVLLAGAEHLLREPPRLGTAAESQRDTYYWYYATQFLFQMGGTHWERWNAALRPLLVESQIQQGALAGSWDPRRPVPDRWAPHAGRLYVTTMNLLSLEVHYRHLPLYVAPDDADSGQAAAR